MAIKKLLVVTVVALFALPGNTALASETRLTGLDIGSSLKVEVQAICVNPLLVGRMKTPFRAKIEAVRGWYGDLIRGYHSKPAPLAGSEVRQGLQDKVEIKFERVDRKALTTNTDCCGQGHHFSLPGLPSFIPIQGQMRPDVFLRADVPAIDFRMGLLGLPSIRGKKPVDTVQALRLTVESDSGTEVLNSYLLLPSEERKGWGSPAPVYPMVPKAGSQTFVLLESAQSDGRFYSVPANPNAKMECEVRGAMKVKITVL